MINSKYGDSQFALKSSHKPQFLGYKIVRACFLALFIGLKDENLFLVD